MTEYWKSQAKKYCDFCKCWIADNAPNVSFHINGWKHKENVKKKISEMTKKSCREYQNELKVDEEIRKMEAAALEAYRKDIEAGADLTSKVINETIAEKLKAKADDAPQKEEELEQEEEDSEKDKEEEPVVEEKKWYEAKSDEDYTYYWHVDTGESRWEPPDEGYVSLAEQKAEEKKQRKQEVAEARKKKADKEQKVKEATEEARAWQEREKMKSLRKPEEKPEEPDQTEDDAPGVMMGPAPRVDPYGGWTVIDNRPRVPVDLQLPRQEYVAVKVPLPQPEKTSSEQPQPRFKEKTISRLDDYSTDGHEVSFKKRRLGSSNKKNARQRLDDDY